MDPSAEPKERGEQGPVNRKNLFISVVIPAGRPDKALRTIRMLQRQSLDPDRYEIVVVTPSAGTFAALDTGNIQVVGVPELYPPGRMRNIGARASTGDFIGFIDDDCLPPENWLSILAPMMISDQSIGIIGCRVIGETDHFWVRCADYCIFAAYQYGKTIFIELGSAAVLVRRQAFQSVNGFDETLMASEDWDLCLKLRNKGWRCLFTPAVEVKHDHGRDSLRKILRYALWLGGRSGLTVQRRHRQRLSWLARLSIRMGSAWCYWVLILPYAGLVRLSYGITFLKSDPRVVIYLPFMFFSGLAYHFGVWKSLLLPSMSK